MIRIQFLLIFMLLGTSVGAQDLRVEYLEGNAKAFLNQKWIDLDFGTKVTTAQSLKLENGAKVVIQAPSYRIYLSKPGNYSLPDLKAAWEKTQGGQNWLNNKIGALFNPKPTTSGSVGGARAGFDFAVDLDTKDLELLTPSLVKLQAGEYDLAAKILEEVLDNAPVEREGKIIFYLAYAQDLNSEKVKALKTLDPAITYLKDEKIFPPMALLKARILLDKGDVDLALSWIEKVYLDLPNAGTRQGLKFIEAICWQSQGQLPKRNAALNAILKIDPSSDIAVLAGTLLK